MPEPSASEPGFRRPVVIVQSDAFNESKIATAVAVVLTSNLRLASAPGNVLMPRRETGLGKDSVANVSQVVTLDKTFLQKRVRTLPLSRMQEIEDGLRLLLGL